MTKGKRILVIDDDPDFLDYVSIILGAHGYTVQTATNARMGLEMMRADPPDLVIADVMISYALDGWNICQEMRADPKLQCIPLMMVSAIVSDRDEAVGPMIREAQVDAFMSKPLEPSALLEHIARLIPSS